ncbi:YggT family protein [Luteimonas saliphila]|uniref:YggT family protein n=1 Tax=Luteimonas saliphila TaxID=2804919 RepID=UPI00192D85E2|nr:YggT family protein [Luteimonas saliphila]
MAVEAWGEEPRQRMVTGVPLYAVVIDYLLGMVMWTLIGRFGMRLFLPEESKFFFSRFFVRVTDPLLKLFEPITPGFLVQPMVPLYVAWFFFLARFYVMPWVLGYSVVGMLSFPLEGQIAQGLYWITQKLLGG